MSFILRRISTTKTGKQIIRDQALPGDMITLGRDAGNVIHIADLAVNPQHAAITSADGRHVRVAASEGLGFDFNGRTVDAADIDSAAGAELRFGGHRLTIAREGDDIILLVERIDELSQSSKDVDEAKAFSLAGVMPGKRMGAWTFGIIVLLAFLIGPIWAWHSFRGVDERPQGYHADMAWSSGPLSSAHANLKGDCQACHVEPFVAVTDKACVGCHTGEHKAMSMAHANAPTAMLLAARHPPGVGEKVLAGFAKAFNRPQGRCVDCHTEHEGAGPMPATPQKFCADCHDGMKARLIDAGFKPTVADAADFGTLHPEFRPWIHAAPGAKPIRASGKAPLDYNGLKFPHDIHLSATGGVARMAASFRGRYDFGNKLECENCHRPESDGVRMKPVEMERDCAMCHSLAFETVGGVTRTLRHGEPDQVVADLFAYYRSTPPTRPLQLGGMERRRPGAYAEGQVYNIYFREVALRPNRAQDAVRAVFSKGGACYDCHTIFAPASGNRWRVQKVVQSPRFLSKGWFDHADPGHAKVECATCHTEAPRSKRSEQLLVPGLAPCRTCHVGESGATIAKVKEPTRSSCAMCHEYHSDGGKPWMPERQRKKKVAMVTDRPPREVYAVTAITGPARRHLYDVTWRTPVLGFARQGG
ncbi:MAG TPA: cytochrome C [Sphingopyxis sp.]|uniref:cytochrome C n=1 Tax=Sphingopyxis sp. TaxID=1908224 RepID=UPI002E327EBB|nr:cytochrome C [Sphingopyxis sp.]HEX2811315.1 cytochrome C [Sphingopyxis sp.]